MIKAVFIHVLLLLTGSVHSQVTRPDNFQIGNFFNVYANDSVRIFFNCTGTIVDKACASFYRVGRIDTASVNVAGSFSDFDMDNHLYFKGNMVKNGLNGNAAYFFKNGAVSEEGSFSNNKRTGVWSYYYPNGKLEKIYSFDGDEPTVLEAYKRNGTAVVIKGSGKLRTEFRNYKDCSSFETWGNVVNGKKDGEWTFSNINASFPIAYETYQGGVFVKGTSNSYVYTEKPSIKLGKFYPNENLNLIENLVGCPGDRGVSFWAYEGQRLTTLFYPRLQEEVSRIACSFKNQWIVVGISLGKEDVVEEINVASSINDTVLENKLYAILREMKAWKTAAINSKPIKSGIYFSVLVDNNKIMILPDYLRHIR